MRKRLLLTAAAVLLAVVLGFLLYASVYYHADEVAREALRSDERVAVS